VKSGYEKERELLFSVITALYKEALVNGASGNQSIRVSENEIIITPSGGTYFNLSLEDLVLCDLSGNVLSNNGPYSSEYKLHQKIYKAFPNINGVIHTHSPYIIGVSSVLKELPLLSVESFVSGFTPVPVTENFLMPGSQLLAEESVRLLKETGSKAVILKNHGLVALGNCLTEAFNLASNLEVGAKAYFVAKNLGNPSLITKETVKK